MPLRPWPNLARLPFPPHFSNQGSLPWLRCFGNKWRWIAVSAVVKLLLTGLVVALAASPGKSASPTAEQALKLTPMQKDVDCDRPTPEEIARCTMKAEKHKGQTGWVIRDGDGKMLREFVDTNGDNVVDRWSYFKDGVEVYRDVDPKFNGKATEHRWLNTAGSRWGVSKGGSSPIEHWKMISAEEVSAEVVGALRDHDPARFNRLLLTQAELKSLGLNAAKTKELADKISAAASAFADLADRQTAVTAKSNWVHFGGNRPGIVPAGTFGAPADFEVYENVVAVVDTDGNDTQIQIGTMIKAGDCWRLVDVPGVPENGKLADSQPGIFFVAGPIHNAVAQDTASSGGNEKIQKIMDELQKLDQQITAATSPEQQAKLNDERADYFEQVIADVGADGAGPVDSPDDRHDQRGRPIGDVSQGRRTVEGALHEAGKEPGRRRFGGVCRIPRAIGRICVGLARPESGVFQDSNDVAAEPGNVRRPASEKSRHGRRYAAVGHRPRIRRPG